MSDNLLETLQRINWNYGRGGVKSYTLDDDGRGVAIRRVPITQRTGFEETRRFRLVRGTVHFLGRQRKVGR